MPEVENSLVIEERSAKMTQGNMSAHMELQESQVTGLIVVPNMLEVANSLFIEERSDDMIQENMSEHDNLHESKITEPADESVSEPNNEHGEHLSKNK